MVAIRFKPVGRKKQRTFRVVVAKKRSKLQGRTVEELGWFDPHADTFELDEARVKYWLENGAQPSDTVYNLFVRAGIISGPKRAVHSTRKRKATDDDNDRNDDSNSGTEAVPAASGAADETTATDDDSDRDDGGEEGAEEKAEAEEKEEVDGDDDKSDGGAGGDGEPVPKS